MKDMPWYCHEEKNASVLVVSQKGKQNVPTLVVIQEERKMPLYW